MTAAPAPLPVAEVTFDPLLGVSWLSIEEALKLPAGTKLYLHPAAPAPEPDPRLLYSMAMRYRHDFGLIEDERERESILTTMRQLWEEVVGLGFYKPAAPATERILMNRVHGQKRWNIATVAERSGYRSDVRNYAWFYKGEDA